MLPLSFPAPDFLLPDVVSGKPVSLADFKDKKAFLIMFICRHCPFVQHVQNEIAKIGRDYRDKDMGIVAISVNDKENYPDDAPDRLKEQAQELDFQFPYLFDENQTTAKAYRAACTPDFFLFDKNKKLIYRGQMDDSRPSNGIPVTGRDLRKAIDAVLFDKPLDFPQKPSMGCNIKWKKGNEPDYFA